MDKKQKKNKPVSSGQMQMDKANLIEYIQSLNIDNIDELNEFLAKNINGKRIDEIVPAKKGKKSNIEKSDDLMYEAYESNLKKGLKLANEALKLNPYNVRAMNFLAENADSLESSFKLYKQAVEIATNQLGEDFFEENKGHFWGMHETRPYMTAKFGYAICLNALGKIDEAIKEFSQIIELNPNDNQGVRYNLASVLLRSKKYDLFLELFEKFDKEESTFFYFNYVLFLFATEGVTKKAKNALIKANKLNKHVLQFITGQKELKTLSGCSYSPGEENEAVFYIIDNFESWFECEGIIDWALSFIENNKKKN